MSESWKAFFYGAFDPAATITIDKLAGAFVPQALSARIFGFHPWSLALPQVIEGVVTVLVMYRAVRQWAGEVPGLLAALLLTLTPIVASVFGHPMEDGALTLCLVLAADAWQRAVATGRLRSLVASGVWVGLGFQAKMLQAWMILPALFIGYLVAMPRRLRGFGAVTERRRRAGPRLGTRLWQLAVAGLAMLAVSLSWIFLFTITPAADRPYVDGSTDNSAFAMVFGYNGLEPVRRLRARRGLLRAGHQHRYRRAWRLWRARRSFRPPGRLVQAAERLVRPAGRLAVPARLPRPGGRTVPDKTGAPRESGALRLPDVGHVAVHRQAWCSA